MSSRREAEHQIKKIRKSRHANDAKGAAADANARSLSRALDMLSTQLYTKSTHFILELIQNADDNTYAPGVSPLLTLVYREDGYLWVGCNEVGFSKANVEAICDVNDSTKKVKDATKGYIGEKGIGFKSVFKVADFVWVSSGHYTFRFDRDQVLGMIVPEWCDFHSTKLVSERTMFCLRIPKVADRRTVKADLLQLRTELLLFLRKLSRIDVRIYDSEKAEPSCGFSLTRNQASGPQPPMVVTLARNNLVKAKVEHSEKLVVSKLVREGMPPEEKREGIRATEIVMAFPTSPSVETRQPRPVYNFLPICTYGFSFLLQADFILTASRESILQNNAWNRSLIDGALDLFVAAVREFNRTGICKYDWPSYVTCNDAAAERALEAFAPRLRKLLQDENVLESQAGYLSSPSELMLVPEHFTDGLDPPKPLFDDVLNTFKYVSFKYPPRDLESLGLTYQSPQQISALLKWMTPEQLQKKTDAWHARLAVGIAQSDPSAFNTAKLIPLRNGEWISAAEEPFYLPNAGDLDIPSGIEVRVISRTACTDPARKHLFSLLGAKPLTESQICNLILERHRFLSISNNNLSASCLISHAWYLFSYGSINMNFGDLKMANELGQAVPGDELYMQLPDCVFRMREYLPRALFDADFVHSDYLNHGPSNSRSRWYKWLADTLHVSTLLNFSSTRTRSITREFQHLIDNYPTGVWMTLVRENWRHYSVDISSISNHVASISVQCTNGKSCQLQDVYLPTTTVMKEPLADQHVPLIDLPDPQHREWPNLEMLGLRTKPDLLFYLTVLRGIAATPASDVDKDTIIHLYHGIQIHFKEDLDLAKTAFTGERLVLSYSSSHPSWRDLKECRWNSPPSLTCLEPLSTHYPSCRELFVEKLSTPDAGAADVLDELCSRHSNRSDDTDTSSATVKDLLLALSTYDLDAPELDPQFHRLARMELAPVRLSPDVAKFTTFTDADWFIPDRSRLAKVFQGKLWFLDFDKKQIDSLKRLLERMGVANRGISRHVVEETVTEGESATDVHLTEELRGKLGYFALLAPTPADREDAIRQPEDIRVLSSPSLILRRSVTTTDGKQIYGTDEQGRATLLLSPTPTVYFSTESIARGAQPLPWYLVCDGLMRLFDVAVDNRALLTAILYTHDHAAIEDFLDRAGLPTEGEDAFVRANGTIDHSHADSDEPSSPDA